MTSAGPPGLRGLPRAERLPLALLLGGGLLLTGLRFNDIFPLNGDNAVYLLLARNLVTGQPYDNAGFPWGYPALLAPGVALFGPANLLVAVPWLKGLSVLAFLLAIGLLYALFRTRHSRLVAGLTVALFAVNDIALFYTNDLLTEMPYLAATAAALLIWQRWAALRMPHAAFGTVLLLALPYYLRSIGLAMLVAPPLVLVWHRRWRAAVLLALALAALAAPWALFSVLTDPNRNYTSAFWLRDPYHPELGTMALPGELLSRMGERVNLYSQAVLPAMLLPQQQQAATAPLRRIGGGLLLLAVVGGYVARLVRRVELPEVYVAGFLVLLCSWWWTGDRFLLPVLPFLIHYIADALVGLAGLAGRLWHARRAGVLAAGVLVLLLVPNLLQDSQAVAQNLRYVRGEVPAPDLSPEDRAFLAACAWLHTHVPPGSVVLARKPSIAEIFAGRPAELIPLIPPAQYLIWLGQHHIAYVLEDSFLWSVHTTDHLRPALALYAAHFRLLDTIPSPAPGDPPTRLWQFVP